MLATPAATLDLATGPDLDAALAALPDQAAVFLLRMRQGAPYLARTARLRRRLRRLLGERPGPARALTLRGLAVGLEYWLTGSRLESALRWYSLAVEHFPETYPKLLKLRPPPYVRLLLSNAFPRTQVTTRLGGSRGLLYGPFRTRAAAEQFEQATLELFQVRRCTEDLAPAPDHPGCIYGEMNMCLRPCQLAVSAEEYQAEVGRLADFLASGGRSLLDPLATARERLSEEMSFEEAARVHKRIQKIEQVLAASDALARDIDKLCGVAVTASVEPRAVELWFVERGLWHDPVRFGFDPAASKTVSLDHRLREIVGALPAANAAIQRREEHLALLARWVYSSWRDGEWLDFAGFDQIPYRKLVRAISRAVKT